MAKKYWLFKSEPSVFSFDDLLAAKNQTTLWEGVRNYQARNYLRDDCSVGDEVFFYHSNADPMAIAGTCTVVKAAYADPMQFDPKSEYYDPKAKKESPPWVVVDIQAKEKFKRPVTREELGGVAALKDMVLLKRGSRLSIQPVTPAEWKAVMKLADKKA